MWTERWPRSISTRHGSASTQRCSAGRPASFVTRSRTPVPQLMLPLNSPQRVAALQAPSSVPVHGGVYCFAALARGRVKARFFGPGLGVSEDPATESAAAALGLYLGSRAGSLEVEIEQGSEIARPSFIALRAEPGRARVGGEVHRALEGALVS